MASRTAIVVYLCLKYFDLLPPIAYNSNLYNFTLKQLKLGIYHKNFYISSPYLKNIYVEDANGFLENTKNKYHSTEFGDTIDKNCNVELGLDYFSPMTNVQYINKVRSEHSNCNDLLMCNNINFLLVCNLDVDTNINNIECKCSMLRYIEIDEINVQSMNLDLSCCLNLEYIKMNDGSIQLSNQYSYNYLKSINIKKGHCWNQSKANNDDKQFVCNNTLFPILSELRVSNKNNYQNKSEFTLIIQNQNELSCLQWSLFDINLNIFVNNANKLNSLSLECNRKINQFEIDLSTLTSLNSMNMKKSYFTNEEITCKYFIHQVIAWFHGTTNADNFFKKVDLSSKKKFSFADCSNSKVDYMSDGSFSSIVKSSYYDNGSKLTVYYDD